MKLGFNNKDILYIDLEKKKKTCYKSNVSSQV